MHPWCLEGAGKGGEAALISLINGHAHFGDQVCTKPVQWKVVLLWVPYDNLVWNPRIAIPTLGMSGHDGYWELEGYMGVGLNYGFKNGGVSKRPYYNLNRNI